ncbi:MAG: hypothetical protein ACYC0H_09165, partial [Solirubrobacteraceae bacterium]
LIEVLTPEAFRQMALLLRHAVEELEPGLSDVEQWNHELDEARADHALFSCRRLSRLAQTLQHLRR